MNKISKIILMTLAFFLITAIGYTLVKRNSFLPTNKNSTQITASGFNGLFQDQSDSGGCGNIFVYKVNKENTVGISVSANKDTLNLSTTEKTFYIGKIDGLAVQLLQGGNIRSLYCNDVLDPNQPKPKKLFGVSGKATITISVVDESLPVWDRSYKSTVVLENVHFSDEKGNNSDVIIDDLIFKDVVVGWLPG